MKKTNEFEKEIQNGLGDLIGLMGVPTQENIVSQADTLENSLRYFMISNNRNLLSQLYVENGLVQTLIKQPVDDAYRDGIKITTNQLDPEEIEELEKYISDMGILDKYIQAKKWGRLFGGSGLIINIKDEEADTPFEINNINEKTEIDFYVADRWELNYQPSGEIGMGEFTRAQASSDTPYYYYNTRLHKSRVLRIVGEEAPSILSLQLMGWGMSEVERLIRSLNSYTKNQSVIFELLDEAKIDVYKIKGLTASLAQKGSTEKISTRFTLANKIKNYLNSVMMDAEDDYQQKQMAFSGLGDILTQIRQGVACDMRMPMTKLFGMSSAGFNSGEDDLENYNSMIESEIRAKDRANLITLVQICCQKLFRDIPDDLKIEFEPLRVLTAEQEQTVKNAEFDRLIRAKDAGLIDEEEATEAINKAGLLPIQIGD